MNIKFYGGINEIGGNKVLVEENDCRIFLDFGTSMGYESGFFSDFLQLRAATGLRDRLDIGALPKVDGIYRNDLFVPENADALDDSLYGRVLTVPDDFFLMDGIRSYEAFVESEGAAFVDGVFLSHAHLDHSGAIGFLHPAIDLYCSPVTKVLVEAIDEVTNFKSLAIQSKGNRIGFTTDRSTFPNCPKLVHDVLNRSVHCLEDMQCVDFGDLKVTCLHQDHSVPGACSFLVESKSGTRLLYTGDIRFHGRYPLTIDEYAEKVGDVDVMVCEGTRVDSTQILKESDIQQTIEKQIKRTKGLVFVDFSWKDTTRYETIRDAVKASDRIFVINARLAYLLHKLGMFPDDDQVAVFLKRKGSCLYSPGDYLTYKYEYGLSCDWKAGIDETHYQHALTAKDIKKHPDCYVMMLSFYDLNQLFDLTNTNGSIPDSFFIKAVCAPFSDEMELDEERLINWLEQFDIGYELGKKRVPTGCLNSDCEKLRNRLHRAHVSGHASQPELLELIGKVSPKIFIPVHTEKARLFEELIPNISADIEVMIPDYGTDFTDPKQ